MRDLFKLIYRFKIKLMFFFNLGYGEVSNLVSAAKDIAILLGFAVLVFKIHLGVKSSIIIGVVGFLGFTTIGVILKATGMSDYANHLSNSVNPQIRLLDKIAEKMGVKDYGNSNTKNGAKTGETLS